jgi:polyhydroxyalkanoate synthesis regulator phasin
MLAAWRARDARTDGGCDMTTVDDLRKTIEALIGTLTPAKAQELAKGFMEPGAAKDQVAKAAGDLFEWSQRNRERMRDLIRREIADQLRGMGAATQSDLDGVKKRVRDLERAAGMTASGRRKATASGSPGGGAKKSGAKKRTTTAAKRTAGSGGTASS